MRKIQVPDLLIRLYMMESNLATLTKCNAPDAVKAKTEARVRQLRQEASDQGMLELYAQKQDELWLYWALGDLNTDFRFECLNFAEHVSAESAQGAQEGACPSLRDICQFGTSASSCGPLCPHWRRMTEADKARLEWE